MSAIPNITMQPVTSSQIAAVGHSPELNVLAIQFAAKGDKPGSLYHYQNFSAADFAALTGAESIGSHFYKHIKPYSDKYPYAKIDTALLATPAAPALTKELLAVALHGREYPFDLSSDEQAQAKAAGLVVIYGNSDDSFEARGAITGQQYVYDHSTVLIDRNGLLPERDNIDDDADLRDFFAREPQAKKVEAIFGAEAPAATWTYNTTIPHATFEIMEDGEVYCRGIVISMADVVPAA